MPMPPLLIERSARLGLLLTVGVPSGYGALVGVMVGASKLAYTILALLAIPGGFLAGLEHEDRYEGVWRGLTGGLLFGTAILFTHDLIGNADKAKLPHPHTWLIVITALGGAVLGGLGARYRSRRQSAASAAAD